MWIEIPYLRSKSGKVYTVSSRKSEQTFIESVGVFFFDKKLRNDSNIIPKFKT